MTFDECLSSQLPGVNPLLIDLISKLLVFDPSKRLTAAQALEHPYLKAYCEFAEEEYPPLEIDMEFENKEVAKCDLRRLLYDDVLSIRASPEYVRSENSVPNSPTLSDAYLIEANKIVDNTECSNESSNTDVSAR